MKQRTILLLGSLFLIATAWFSSCKPTETTMLLPNGDSEKTDVDIFMRQAVYNGLINDRFPQSTALHILNNVGDFFVGKCPICLPTERGIKEYVTYLKSNPEEAKSKTKASADLISSIEGSDKEARLMAFNELLQGYTSAHKERLKLTEAQLTELNGKLEEARKTGMSRKSESFGKFCPSCDAACDIKK